MSPAPWYVTTFNEDYLALYSDHLETRTQRELAGLEKLCPLASRARILDLGCGHGRHSLELAQRGFRVTGVDLSPLFLDRARQTSQEVRWLQQDMRQITFVEEFDAVVSLYHAFGYFAQDSENLKVLQAIYRALVPGGYFLLDLIGAQAIPGYLGQDIVEMDTYWVNEVCSFRKQRLEIEQTFHYPEQEPKTYNHSLRIYEAEELGVTLESVGFRVEGQWGDFDGCACGEGDRLITRARKPQ